MQPLHRDGRGLLSMEQVLNRNDINKAWCSHFPGDIYLGGLLTPPCDVFFENAVQEANNEHFQDLLPLGTATVQTRAADLSLNYC